MLLLSCKENSQAQLFDEKLSQPFTDPRDGKQYKTIKIGTFVYMADNLDYETRDSLSWCYKGDCKKYWRLYKWEKANSVCPSGWHLPTIYEWVNLDKAVFLLPDGHCDDIARFDMFLYDGWWAATKAENDVAYIYNPKIKKPIAPAEIDGDINRLGCTLRCIQDNPYTNPFVIDSAFVTKLGNKEYENNVDSSLLAKYKTVTNWCRVTEQDISEISKFAKNDALLKMFITYNYNMICTKPAEITTYWLNSKAKEYERLFNKPVPECKQCTDLELLLMLENAIETDVAELDIATKEENAELKAELKKAQIDYERKFKIRAPWWYICSDKEHLERLQKAVKTNKPELDYSYGSQMMDYKVGKRLASYEWLFKKPAPNWDEKECSDEERWKRLKKAIEENKPYLSEEEEKNRHSIHFRDGDYYITNISVSKTAAGAVVKYELPTKEKRSSADTLEANLSAKEWQNLTDTLQKLGIMEWESFYVKPPKGHRSYRGGKNWELEIFLPNNAKFKSGGYYTYPPNYDEFVKLMEDIKKKAAQKLESKIKTEYEKKFKKPITEQELSTEQVRFSLESSNKTPINFTSEIIITRTKTGAVAYYSYGPEEGIKLSMDDWLDFIYDLYKSSFMKWDEEYGKMRMQALFNDTYWLDIYNSNSFNPKKFAGYNKYPPNWDKFLKVMNDIRAKAKKDSATKEIEDKLKTEYKKRFGKPISDFELSIRSMNFGAFSKWIDNSVSVRLNRTARGALIEYYAGSEGVQLSEKLSMEEWLDLLNNLQKCPSNGRGGKFERWDICCRKNLNDYSILDIYVTWRLEIKSSGDSDELKFYANDICTPKWDEFMKIISNKKAAWK